MTNPRKRYTQPVIQAQPGPEFKMAEVPLFEDPKGKWVKWEDYERLRKALEAIKERGDTDDSAKAMYHIARVALGGADEPSARRYECAGCGKDVAECICNAVKSGEQWGCLCGKPDCPYCGPRLASRTNEQS